MGRRTPQEKKRLSYLRDRRNTYGENDKSSRKAIHRRKQIVNQANRRIVRQGITAATSLPDQGDLEEAVVEATSVRPKRWSKEPDEPLGEVLPRQLRRRAEMRLASPTVTEARIERIKKHARG